jgi:hypothetical protein
MKDGPCPRTVFSQTQKTRNVCLKRRFQFVGRRLQIENPFPFAGKSSPIFTLRFALGRPCFTSQKQDWPELHFASKRLTLSIAPGSTWPGGLENHFCQGAKMYNQSFRLGF